MTGIPYDFCWIFARQPIFGTSISKLCFFHFCATVFTRDLHEWDFCCVVNHSFFRAPEYSLENRDSDTENCLSWRCLFHLSCVTKSNSKSQDYSRLMLYYDTKEQKKDVKSTRKFPLTEKGEEAQGCDNNKRSTYYLRKLSFPEQHFGHHYYLVVVLLLRGKTVWLLMHFPWHLRYIWRIQGKTSQITQQTSQFLVNF